MNQPAIRIPTGGPPMAVLDSATLRAIVGRIAAHFQPAKIILFGSRASGEATDQSDVDLLVVAETDLPLAERYPAVRRLLSGFPFAFDVFLKTPAEFDRSRSVVNTIAYFADRYGRVVHER